MQVIDGDGLTVEVEIILHRFTHPGDCPSGCAFAAGRVPLHALTELVEALNRITRAALARWPSPPRN